MTGATYDFAEWGADRCGWDIDTGAPGIALFANAIQVWSFLQNRPTSVAEAALAFNVAPERIVEAVDDAYWMFLEGDRGDWARLTIEHEGE